MNFYRSLCKFESHSKVLNKNKREKMKHKILLIGMLYGQLLISGCVTSTVGSGTAFVRPSEKELMLGKTTKPRLLEKLDKPYSVKKFSENQKVVERYSFIHYTATKDPFSLLGQSLKGFSAYFVKDTLVAYSYSSSGFGDDTNFDEKKVELIQKGKTTMQGVIQLIGEPTEKWIFPMTDGENDMDIGYYYENMSVAAKGKKDVKALRITIDSVGIVKKIDMKINQDVE